MKLTIVLAPVIALLLAAAPAVAQSRMGQLATLTFKPGAADLGFKTEETSPKLGEVAAWAQANPDGLVVLDGHADRNGSSTKNVQLSLRRAKTVRAELVTLGVDPEMIVIAAYGEESPSSKGNLRRVVIWGTRAGMNAVVSRTMARGHAVIWTGLKTQIDLQPQPGALTHR